MLTPENVVYTARATSTGGRAGHVRSEDGVVEHDLGAPAEMGGAGGTANPELLFAAGYSACYQNAFEGVAKREGIDASASTVTAEVGFGKDPGGGFGLIVTLHAAVPGLEIGQVVDLMAKAHAVCPYSKATRGNIAVTLVADPV